MASHSYNTETDLGGVKQVLEQPNMNMAPGKHYSFSVGQLAWHLIAGKACCQEIAQSDIIIVNILTKHLNKIFVLPFSC